MGKNAMRGGAYSAVITVVVLAILVVVNICLSVLPASATEYDISASKLYSVTSNTKSVLNALSDDVTIYWIVQADDAEDAVIEKLLDRYESLSEHISVEKRNPDVYPTFIEEYIGEDDAVYNNSLVVECGERSRYIPYTDIYVTETSLYSYSYTTSFDGEGTITSAIDYVTNPDQPVIYRLTGHGESDLPSTFADNLEKENIAVEGFLSAQQRRRPGGRGGGARLFTGKRSLRGGGADAGGVCGAGRQAAGHGRARAGREPYQPLRHSGALWRDGGRGRGR